MDSMGQRSRERAAAAAEAAARERIRRRLVLEPAGGGSGGGGSEGDWSLLRAARRRKEVAELGEVEEGASGSTEATEQGRFEACHKKARAICSRISGQRAGSCTDETKTKASKDVPC